MGVTLRIPRVRMAQQTLYYIQRNPTIDEEAGEGMPQIVQAQIGQFRPLFDPKSGKMQRR